MQTRFLHTTIQWFILIQSMASNRFKNIHNIKHWLGDFTGPKQTAEYELLTESWLKLLLNLLPEPDY